jgi:hypothetical protein
LNNYPAEDQPLAMTRSYASYAAETKLARFLLVLLFLLSSAVTTKQSIRV